MNKAEAPIQIGQVAGERYSPLLLTEGGSSLVTTEQHPLAQSRHGRKSRGIIFTCLATAALIGLVIGCASPAARTAIATTPEVPQIPTATTQAAESTPTPGYKLVLPGPGATSTPEPTKPAPAPTETPIPATATPVPPTEIPAPTAVPTEKAKKSENILPEYSVFYGQMKRENGTGTGSAIIANIPGYPDKLYTFFIENRSGQGLLSVINKTDGNSLEAEKGVIKITLSEDAETLSGRLEKFGGYGSPATPWVFEIKYYGTGKAALIEAAKKLWAKEVANAPANWVGVPDETILGAGFRKIELP